MLPERPVDDSVVLIGSELIFIQVHPLRKYMDSALHSPPCGLTNIRGVEIKHSAGEALNVANIPGDH